MDLEISRIRELTTVLNGVMRTMHLPEAIEETTGSGVPRSITEKAADVRVKGGMDKILHLSSAIPGRSFFIKYESNLFSYYFRYA